MDENQKKTTKLVLFVIGFIIIVFVVLTAIPVASVGAGERGVIFNRFTGVQDRVMGEGLHFRIPFVESVHTVSIKVQKTDIKAEAATADLQSVNADVVVNWHLDAKNVNKVYQEVGDQQTVVDRVLTPAVSEVVKAATAKYTAEEVIGKRPLLKQDIDEILSARLVSYHIIVDDVSIVNIDFSPDFNAAIEAKNVAVQNAQKATNDLVRIKTEAEQTVAKATADAMALKIKNEALATNPALIEYEKAQALRISAEKGIKIVPDIMMGSGITPLINLK